MTSPSDTPPAYVPVVQYQPPATVAPSPPPARPARRRRWPIAVAIVAVLVLAGGGYLAWNVFTGDTFTVRGTVLLVDDDIGLGERGCAGTGGYSDMRAGTQVTVTDPAGTVVAVGQLGVGDRRGDTTGTRCAFPFEVAGVPGGHAFYGVEVSRRGRLQYTEAQVRDAPLALELGT